ncbi:hypothetical protein Nepgr_010069 [Nepenthes gracilis]|uniref:F-box domain-containing protein n=1 Tax=Nepenthes gracilis TaxID=150966 RepID=A0AAD3SC94_NEPGR|nr:hypothetical protein Nepgr_010069 [Nepenthes gracilis]
MTQFQALIPGLPEELAIECLSRLHHTAHLAAAAAVCRRWHHLIKSRDFFNHRKKTGRTQFAACLIQAVIPHGIDEELTGPPASGITFFDPMNLEWNRVDTVHDFPDGVPLFCQVSSSEGKLVLMGGWHPKSFQEMSSMFVYDITTRRFRRVKDMPSKRSLFATGEIHGKVFVAGGHDEEKNALDSAWVYDIEGDAWTELTRMSEKRDECHGLVIGSEFWVISGYDTDHQGMFKPSAEVYDTELAQWRRVEDAWNWCQSPKLCVGAGKNGKLINWAELNSEVRVGTCAVELGNRILVSGSAADEETRRCFLVERDENGEYGAFKELTVPRKFQGVIRSACCVEI